MPRGIKSSWSPRVHSPTWYGGEYPIHIVMLSSDPKDYRLYGVSRPLLVRHSNNVADIKNCCVGFGIPVEQQRLTFACHILKDHWTIGSYGMSGGCEVILTRMTCPLN